MKLTQCVPFQICAKKSMGSSTRIFENLQAEAAESLLFSTQACQSYSLHSKKSTVWLQARAHNPLFL
ncbi:uncharacterized protein PHALS_04986 [Plasmopara halstedii]|uniref:Uncharacterized protein n=1 Tax=Plasmopara halstedii TaxID=4781 RepID=A0A0P1AAF9_PLAHL|nr:uncharacterized protein PHALS_04986 [Plasmopara halstedii]CEG37392.1 hypothetical protein PHALS_04986 [Plasmopara halstedii]|eukprot:XP_024573761.1 hypothetical protein PHALS_04986 [Plasmopara halstedii]